VTPPPFYLRRLGTWGGGTLSETKNEKKETTKERKKEKMGENGHHI